MQRFLITILITIVLAPAALAQDDMQKKVTALGSTLGAAVGQERRVDGGGRVREFEKGAIFWSRKTGARFVGSGALEKYKELGAEGGQLGYPVSDERMADGNLRQTFEHGFITTTAAGTVEASVLSGVTFTTDSLTVATASPIMLELDNTGFLVFRETTGPDVTLSCSCTPTPSPDSQRLGFCTVVISRKGKNATCRSSTCSGSCAFETVSR